MGFTVFLYQQWTNFNYKLMDRTITRHIRYIHLCLNLSIIMLFCKLFVENYERKKQEDDILVSFVYIFCSFSEIEIPRKLNIWKLCILKDSSFCNQSGKRTTVTDVNRPTHFIYYKWISLIANKEI